MMMMTIVIALLQQKRAGHIHGQTKAGNGDSLIKSDRERAEYSPD